MSHLFVSLDLVAGLLVGIHLWVPERYRKQWDKWLIRNLAPDSNPIDEKTVKGSIIVATLVVIGIMTWGYFVDIGKGSFTSQELINVSLLVIAGIPPAVILLVAVITLYQRIKTIQIVPLVGIITILGVVVSPLTLLLVNVANQLIDRIIIGFVFSLAVIVLLVQFLPLARKFFTFESGVLARLGVTIFVVGRIIQIANLQ